MIRRCFLAALLFCAVSCPMMAQGGKVNVLYLDGTAHEVQMSQVAKLTVADGNVKLLSKSGATVATHAVKNVDKIELKGSTAGMVQLTKQSPITLRSNGYTITAEGMTDGKLLEVYAANGSLAAQYNGAYTEVVANENHFIVDSKRYEMRAAFAEKKTDGVNFYLTPGNIGSANELDNCYYYVRLFVPQSNMDGSELDVQGNKKYELTFVDNVTDVNNPQTFSISNDALASATGTISVLDNGDGTYTIKSKASSIKSARMLVMKENDWDDALNEYQVETPTMAWADFMATTDKAEDVTEVVKQFNGKFTFKKSFSDAERGWYVAVLAVTDEYGTTVSRSTFHSHIADAEFGTLSKIFLVE